MIMIKVMMRIFFGNVDDYLVMLRIWLMMMIVLMLMIVLVLMLIVLMLIAIEQY